MLLEEEQHRVWPIDHRQSDLIPEEFVKAPSPKNHKNGDDNISTNMRIL
jgi:hypothetical protein